MPELLIPVSIGLRGDVKMIMRNVVTGEVETREMRNTLLNTYLNAIFNKNDMLNDGLLNESNMNYCRIGTSDQAAARGDTGIIGTVLASNASAVSNVYSGANPRVREITWLFPAGTGTGTVKEVLLHGSALTATARQVVSPALEKTAQHELTVIWKVSMTRGADSWSGVIPAGQRDGITDVNWVATINDNQLYFWANHNHSAWNVWNIITGTSNAASDLVNDAVTAIKGTQIFSGSPTYREALAYTAGNFYRDVRAGFETTQSNGQIGEAVLGTFMRVTFNPPLDKADTYRLYLTFRLAVVNAS
jgi:hypothetical protein